MSKVVIDFDGFCDELWDDFVKVLDVLRKYGVDAKIYFGKPEGCSRIHIIVWTGENIIPEEVELDILKRSKWVLVW